jgi:hypothetical protein
MTADLARLADLIGSDGWIAAMGILFFFGVGELVHRAVAGHHRVPHYKLRAAAAHLHPQSDVPEAVALGSTAPSGEPLPAPTVPTDPGAGTNLQSGLSRLEQGRRRDHSSEQPQPAPPSSHPGAGIPAGSTPHQVLPAGPKPRVTVGTGGCCGDPVRDADTPPQPSSTVSASPIKRPAIVADTPESTAVAGLPAHVWSTAVAGLPTPGWGSGPSAVAADGPVRSV